MPYRLENLLNTKMGNIKSKRKEKNENIYKKNDKKKSNLSQDLTNDSYDKWLNDPDMKILRKTLEHNPEIFILNNLMMCVQFFENFDEEMRIIRESPVSSRETEFNSCLPVQKHALVPDVLQEQVAKKIDFAYAKHDIFCIEPLQPIRVFIVFDNVEVTEQNYASPYSSMNEALIYNMQLKQSEHKGYVMLQRLEVNPSKKKTNTSHNDAIYSDDNESVYSTNKSTIDTATSHQDKKLSGSGSSSLLDEDIINYDYNNNRSNYNDKIVQKLITNDDTINNSLIKSKELSSSSSDSTSSGYRSGNYTIDSDSDGSYPQSKIYKTKNLSLIDKKLINNNINNSEIPKNCFTLIAEDKIYNCRKDRKQKFNNSKKEIIIKGVLYNRNYGVLCLNSTKFMNWFYDFFTNELSEIMGFNNNDQEPDGAVIYRDKLEILDPPIYMKDDNFGIIPCIWSSWPSIANEWLDRTRGTWPSVNVIEKIRESGCYIIPDGYYTENINNHLQNIEWELTFPAAERYLETSMSSSQTRVYIISLLLQKTFFRPVNSIIGLTDVHIKNQLFWLIEEDDRQSRTSTENRTGEFLLKLLNSLYKSISQDVPILQDYFIKDKNLFQGKIYLLRSQKQLKRIIENPIMYILHAMQNIRHSKKFFPKFDYGKLLKILTEDVLLLINPQLIKKNISKSMSKLNDIEKDYEQTNGFWGSAKQINENSRIYGKKTITNKTLIDAETSYDQVIEIAVRCAEMDSRRLNLLLDFFICHFIKIAEYHHNYKSMIQKNLYIEHAERLAVLLSENSIDKNDAKIHLDKIQIMKEKSTDTRLKINAPKTPKRNSDPPIFITTLKDRYKNMAESQSNIEDSNSTKNEIPQDELSLIEKIDSTVQKKHVTMAIVHEDELESIEQRHQDKITTELPNVISLKKPKDSILNETTYI